MFLGGDAHEVLGIDFQVRPAPARLEMVDFLGEATPPIVCRDLDPLPAFAHGPILPQGLANSK
jgi:hypothetical protein